MRFDSKTAIVFGRESNGLSNEELSMCDSIITIPASTEYPVLNLSHAVAVVLYELSKQYPAQKKETLFSRIGLMQPKQRDLLYRHVQTVTEQIIADEQKQKNIVCILKKMIARSGLSRRESFALFGFFKKLYKTITEQTKR
jgi:TrmH family RNA methyltransferase